jgi:hypothetical protein
MKKIIYVFVLIFLFQTVSCEKADLVKDNQTGGEAGGEVDDTSSASGSDTTSSVHRNHNDALTVQEFFTCHDGDLVHVKGYIVGSCERNIVNADFTAPFKGHTAVLLADKPEETNNSKIMIVGLKTGKVRNSLNLEDHPELYGKLLDIDGYKGEYQYAKGIKPVDLIDWTLL